MMSEESSDGELDGFDIFHEDEQPLPEPIYQVFERVNGSRLTLRLVGQSPLWGHLLWSAGKIMANYLDTHAALIYNKAVLELGAAGALPSLVCALNDAAIVVATDYPDSNLIENMQYNMENCLIGQHSEVIARGYIWGRDVDELLDLNGKQRFDLILLSDLVFNHQAHHDLLKTCSMCLSYQQDAQVLVFFTHHRPHLAEKDDQFLTLAEEYSFVVEKIIEDISEKNIMFQEDQGSREVRATVHGYRFTRS